MRACARSLIARRLGLDFPGQRDDDLERRLLRACRASGATDAARYVDLLATLPGDSREWKRLVSHFTVGETYFFRDRGFLEVLEQHVLGSLIERRRREGMRRLRIWSAGCSSGEEAYSLAMLVDGLLPDRSDWSVTILATDVNPSVLSAGRRGIYREWSFRQTPESVRGRYFADLEDGTFEITPSIREMVAFAPLNLAEEVYPSPATNTSAMDLILCRNVIMYFTREAQRATVGRLQSALVEGGWLCVSPAEASADLLRPLEPVNFPGAILFRKVAGRNRRPAAAERPRQAPPPSTPQRSPLPPRVPATPQVAEQPGERASLLELAHAAADSGNLQRARELCREAVSGNPLDVESHLLLAAIEQERDDLGAAAVAIRSAIYLAPDSASTHFALGSLLLRQGRSEKARRSMATVVSLLSSVPSDQAVPGADGLTAGRLLEIASAHLGTT